MMKQKPIKLQQSEEEGRCWWHEPNGSVAVQEGKLPRLEVDEREGASLHPVVIPRRLPPETRLSTTRSALVQRRECGG
jgi:hypothetical protein